MSVRDRVQSLINGGDPSAALRTRYRDAAMNWIALGVLLSAWHMEGRIDRTLSAQSNAHVANPSNGRGTQPLWNARPRETSWISRAASGAALAGVQHVVPPASIYNPVSTLRMIRRWLPGV